MAPDPGHRASDADREAVSAVIRDAVADGRLGMDELDERLSAVWGARTYGELALTTTDLPIDPRAVLSERSTPAPAPAVFAGRTQPDAAHEPTTETTVAIFGSTERRGSWTVPTTFNAVAAFGGIELDLREATLTGRETVIHAVALFGGITITVGEDVELTVRGAGILGGFQGTSSGIRRPGAPVVRVVGAALFGGVEVRQRPPRGALRRGDERVLGDRGDERAIGDRGAGGRESAPVDLSKPRDHSHPGRSRPQHPWDRQSPDDRPHPWDRQRSEDSDQDGD